MDQVGMDLPQGDDRPGMVPAHAEFLEKSCAIALNRGPGVLLGKSEIEVFAAVSA